MIDRHLFVSNATDICVIFRLFIFHDKRETERLWERDRQVVRETETQRGTDGKGWQESDRERAIVNIAVYFMSSLHRRRLQALI